MWVKNCDFTTTESRVKILPEKYLPEKFPTGIHCYPW